MNRYFVGLLMLGLMSVLATTNPHSKTEYSRKAARQIKDWCAPSESEFCLVIRRTPIFLLEGWIYVNTDAENYFLFTRFHTQTFCIDVYGLGLGNSQIIWPVVDEAIRPCRLEASVPD